MRVRTLQLVQLPLILLDLLLYVLLIILYIDELGAHLGHHLAVPKGARGRGALDSSTRVHCLLEDHKGLSRV